LLGARLPTSFLPEEDQGYVYVAAQLPYAASLERTDAVCKKIEDILKNTPGVKYYTTVEGFSLLSQVQATYNAFFFVTLKPWSERKKPDEQIMAIRAHLNRELSKLPEATALAFRRRPFPASAPPAVSRSCWKTVPASKTNSFLTQNLDKFMAAARKRPEIAGLLTTYLPSVPQVFVKVDRDKVLKLGIPLNDVYARCKRSWGDIL
jgi:HAE1 family hydrophobic/amphiphilic exporter-1